MSKCDKCEQTLGVFIEDDLGTLCQKCHPQFMNPCDPKEVALYFDSIDFPRTRKCLK